MNLNNRQAQFFSHCQNAYGWVNVITTLLDFNLQPRWGNHESVRKIRLIMWIIEWCETRVCSPCRVKNCSRQRQRDNGSKRGTGWGPPTKGGQEQASRQALSTRCTMRAKTIWDSACFRRFSIPYRLAKCVAWTELTNKPNTASVEYQWWDEGCLTLCSIWRSGYLCGLLWDWFVAIRWQTLLHY